ncbi:MAG: metallophosphoesterase family protein [Gemmatimonadales bacterium]
MKLAHIADPHLGIRQYNRQNAAGTNQREADVARAFRIAIDGVIADRPDVVVVAGDLFHSVRPTNAAIVFAFQQFQRLREALPDAPVVLIAGNHDTPRLAETGSILRLFEEVGVHVVPSQARRLEFPELDLSIFAVPHQALVGADRPLLRPEGDARYRVLLLHGEIEGVFPGTGDRSDYGSAPVGMRELGADDWSYVALGDYHVQFQVDKRAWYAGALEYVSPNFWSDLQRETELRPKKELQKGGKGWLLADLDTGEVKRRPVPWAREIVDLDPVEAAGMSAATLDEAIAARIASLEKRGGIDGKIVRLRVWNVPRHIARELDHAAIRGYKSAALNFNLDLRRPATRRTVGVGAPGRRQTLSELVREYLEKRPLPDNVHREEFVRVGMELMDVVERELVET